MIVLGIDPGLDGALALVSEEGVLEIFDTPSVAVKGGRAIDAYGVHDWMRETDRKFLISYAFIEQQWVRPQKRKREDGTDGPATGPAAGLKTGINYGITIGLLTAMRWRVDAPVSPQRWKRALGLSGQPKDASRKLACDIWPSSAHLFARKKDVDRAEACLIAHYGLKVVL